jgi:hypothetical protein
LLGLLGLVIALYIAVTVCVAVTVAILPLLHKPNADHPPVYPNALQVQESQGVDEERRPYKELTFVTRDHPTAVVLYYDRAFQEDGWGGTDPIWLTPSATNTYTHTRELHTLNSGRYNLFLNVQGEPNNQTSVTLRVTKPPLPYETPTAVK